MAAFQLGGKHLELSVANLPSQRLAYTNKVFVNVEDYNTLKSWVAEDFRDDKQMLVSLQQCVYMASPLSQVEKGNIAMNGLQRRFCVLALGKALPVSPYVPSARLALATLSLNVDLLSKGKAGRPKVKLDCGALGEAFKSAFR
eukprot:CAMPEP_0113940568 /NCGR_PEP_ID=MMETSP1339-20121228/6675_1 /TAXON_ID=94617 /ORGANISM="Fibrocapsa japonica" /LENGTH=142 /DNA_ID=CAMNT_0000944441 /DNA_START=97 /DNA_END=521 /DNA_ORIENTATION=- /assembly_acc=CAM_ASM_000762